MDNTLKDDEVCEHNLDLETKVRLGCNKVNMFIKGNRTKTTFGSIVGQHDSWTKNNLGTGLKFEKKIKIAEVNANGHQS